MNHSMIVETSATLGPPLIAVLTTAALLIGQQAEPLPPVILTPEVLEILAHKTLRLWCLLGALSGGVIMVLLTKIGSPKEMSAKWIVSTLSGVIFTPWLLRISEIPAISDYIVAASAGVALLSWGCLHALLPILEKQVIGRVRRLFGDNSDPGGSPKP